LLVEASGQIVPNAWILYPIAGQKTMRWIVSGVSITGIGLGLMGMAKTFKLSVTVVMA